MKYYRIHYILILLGVISIFSCKRESDEVLFANTRPNVDGKYFQTASGASLYAAAFNDEILDTLPYSLIVRGNVSFNDTSKIKIVEYGHVWSTKENPKYHPDSITINANTALAQNQAFSYNSTIAGLKMLTPYFLRAYIKLENGEIGYNPVTTKIQTISDANIWIRKGEFNGGARYGAFTFVYENKAFIGGGRTSLSIDRSLWRYSPSEGSWSQMAAMPIGRAYGVAFTVKNKSFAGLGEDVLGTRLSDFYEYLHSDNDWKTVHDELDEFPGGARTKAVAFSIGDFGYVGTGDVGGVLSDFLVFNLSDYISGRKPWDPSTNLSKARKGAVAFVIGEIAYVGLGVDGDGNLLKDFYMFRPENNGWSQMEDFPGEARQGAFAFAIYKDYDERGEGYIGGGGNDTIGYNDFYMYLPDEDKWYIRNTHENMAVVNAVGFSLSYQRSNESFPTMKGFMATGFIGNKSVKNFYEFLP